MALSPYRRCRRSTPSLMSLPFIVGILLASLRSANQLVELMRGDDGMSQFAWWPELTLNGTSTVGIVAEDEGPPPVIATAILVEMRCHSAFSVALHAAVRNLGPEVLLLVMHSSHNGAFVRGVIKSSPVLTERFRSERLAVRQIREEDWGLKCPEPHKRNCGVYSGKFWYSAMFVNARFWDGFETPYVLTLQSDTLLCRQFPTRELIERGTSFTGGVSGMGSGFKQIPVTQDPRHGVLLRTEYLNGGMSFRNVRWVRDCIRRYTREEGWIEDEMYRHCRENDINGTVHETAVGAYSFSSDNGVTMCFAGPAGGCARWGRTSRGLGRRRIARNIRSSNGTALDCRILSECTTVASRGERCVMRTIWRVSTRRLSDVTAWHDNF